MSDYITIKNQSSDEFVEKRSRFIGHIKPVTTRDEAEAFIAEIKSKYWDARHNVYAYVLRDGQFRKYSDDGEPQGTAGVPVLEVLLKENVTDCVVVVTRYFGGILLGTGGLTRAYSKAARIAIAAGEIKNMVLCEEMRIACDYSFYGKLGALLGEMGAVIISTDFSEDVAVTFALKKSETGRLNAKLIDLSNGRYSAEKIGEEYYSI
ncbi:MAG: YigZ family protein [Clostridia bacterium]|nr:YigZ family protein [Clostridia bacterium]